MPALPAPRRMPRTVSSCVGIVTVFFRCPSVGVLSHVFMRGLFGVGAPPVVWAFLHC